MVNVDFSYKLIIYAKNCCELARLTIVNVSRSIISGIQRKEMLPFNIGKIKCPNVAFRLIVSNARKVNRVVSSLVTAVCSSNMDLLFHYFNTF